jgi:hypothetical protein
VPHRALASRCQRADDLGEYLSLGHGIQHFISFDVNGSLEPHRQRTANGYLEMRWTERNGDNINTVSINSKGLFDTILVHAVERHGRVVKIKFAIDGFDFGFHIGNLPN